MIINPHDTALISIGEERLAKIEAQASTAKANYELARANMELSQRRIDELKLAFNKVRDNTAALYKAQGLDITKHLVIADEDAAMLDGKPVPAGTVVMRDSSGLYVPPSASSSEEVAKINEIKAEVDASSEGLPADLITAS